MGLVAAACVTATAAAADTARERADAAWVDGRQGDALRLYEQVLEGTPDDTVALVRSGRLLSWNDRLDEALARYDRALAVDPGLRDAALGRATVLSWAGRLDEAAEAFGDWLEAHPDDRDARLGLARTLAWNGRYDSARAEYDRLLARDAGDVEAMVGRGRTEAWDGRLDVAREWYERALRVDPDSKEARVGLAYVDLWSGAVGRAARLADDLQHEQPDDRDVAELSQRVAQARAPWITGRAERTTDTDDNTLDVAGVRGGWRPGGGVGLTFGAARYDMGDPSGDASIDALDAALTISPARGQSLTFSAGVDRRSRTDGTTDSELVGSVNWDARLDRRWPLRLFAARTPIRYSPLITDNGITVDEFGIGTSGRVGSRWRVNLDAGAANVSDDNDRVNLVAGCEYALRRKGPALDLGATVRYLDYERDTPGGYFDPADFTAVLVHGVVHDTWGARENTWRVAVTTGVQSFIRGRGTGSETDVTGDSVLVLSATLGFPFGRGLTLEAYGTWGDYAAQNAGGFESTTAGLRLRWRRGN